MCRPVPCKRCGKTTWAGCGQHVDAVRASVPAGEWCGGHADDPAARKGLFARLTGR
ncbi:hypothetical protein [Propioniciclava soli]|uniref:Uncharacterized protein n=1 Tax=Propioniciclava soli TaxID=2775081 RepID=A0ABZ3C601_9ACTN|nr:hypothetical protein [Propioniciclava soli]